VNESQPRNQGDPRQRRHVRRNNAEESPDIESSEIDRLVRVIFPNQERTDQEAADGEECIDASGYVREGGIVAKCNSYVSGL
jgi:hypothetical protein